VLGEVNLKLVCLTRIERACHPSHLDDPPFDVSSIIDLYMVFWVSISQKSTTKAQEGITSEKQQQKERNEYQMGKRCDNPKIPPQLNAQKACWISF
jgi:hypothetical protein